MATLNARSLTQDYRCAGDGPVYRQEVARREIDLDGHPLINQLKDLDVMTGEELTRLTFDIGTKLYEPKMLTRLVTHTARPEYLPYRDDLVPQVSLEKITGKRQLLHATVESEALNLSDEAVGRINDAISHRREDIFEKAFKTLTGQSASAFANQVTSAPTATGETIMADMMSAMRKLEDTTGIPFDGLEPRFGDGSSRDMFSPAAFGGTQTRGADEYHARIPMHRGFGANYGHQPDYVKAREMREAAERKRLEKEAAVLAEELLEREALESNPLYGAF